MDEHRRQKYLNLLAETKQEIDSIDKEVEIELQKIKLKIAELQQEKEAQLSIYSGYCQLLGVPNEFEGDEPDDTVDDK